MSCVCVFLFLVSPHSKRPGASLHARAVIAPRGGRLLRTYKWHHYGIRRHTSKCTKLCIEEALCTVVTVYSRGMRFFIHCCLHLYAPVTPCQRYSLCTRISRTYRVVVVVVVLKFAHRLKLMQSVVTWQAPIALEWNRKIASEEEGRTKNGKINTHTHGPPYHTRVIRYHTPSDDFPS